MDLTFCVRKIQLLYNTFIQTFQKGKACFWQGVNQCWSVGFKFSSKSAFACVELIPVPDLQYDSAISAFSKAIPKANEAISEKMFFGNYEKNQKTKKIWTIILLSSKKHENIKMLSTGTSLLKWVQLIIFVRSKTFVCLKIHMHEIFIVFFKTLFCIFQSLIDTKHSTSTFSKSS